MSGHRMIHYTSGTLGIPSVTVPTESLPDLTAFGWAPGTYMHGCVDCDEELGTHKMRHMGDKRSIRCLTHALAALAEAAEHSLDLRKKKITPERHRVQRATLEFIRDSLHNDADYLREAAATTLRSLDDQL